MMHKVVAVCFLLDHTKPSIMLLIMLQSLFKHNKIHDIVKILNIHIVVSIEFSPLSTVELTTNWYHLHNGDYQLK